MADDESFVDFVTGSKPWLLTAAWMLTGNGHAAEELVQETLVRVYLRWKWIGDEQPAAYARRTLTNLHTDTWRRRRREVLTGEDADGAGRDSDPRNVDLVRALRTLGPRERECVVLRHYLDLSERQTADELGIGVGAVKGYTSRGLAALRDAMKEADHV